MTRNNTLCLAKYDKNHTITSMLVNTDASSIAYWHQQHIWKINKKTAISCD